MVDGEVGRGHGVSIGVPGEFDMQKRVRVAIVGGGCAGLTAAYELTQPEHGGRFDVTVYQMGFRLGGKGASGRGAGDRIEEHGLHLWLGFYENAFRIMRDCYAELGRDPFRCPVATFDQAFKPAPVVSVTDRNRGGDWEPWVARFPATDGLPGDACTGASPFSPARYLEKAAKLVVELLRSAGGVTREPTSDPTSSETSFPRAGAGGAGPERVVEVAEWLLRHGQLATTAVLAEGMDVVCKGLTWLSRGVPGAAAAPLLQLLSALSNAIKRQLSHLVAGDPQLGRVWQVIDLILACIRGSIAHGVLIHPHGFDAVDEYDWRQWLALHGASSESLDSGFMRGIYDLAFAYEGGDPARPRLSAAAALRGAMRMFFTYRGSLFWRMSAGMGDIVFAPLYEVLKKRGVRFEFFHRFERTVVGRDPRGLHISELHFSRQAEIKQPEYQPLIDVHGLPCWPAKPDYDQLVDGERAEREAIHFESPWEERVVGPRILRVGQDFDFFVLAIGGGAVPATCGELAAHSVTHREAFSHLNTVATQALQVWMTPDLKGLGWKHPPVNLSGWVEPFDTWADMSHLIPAENISAEVGSIAYFCSPLADAPEEEATGGSEFERSRAERVRLNALHFLQADIGSLWPGALDDSGEFRWDLLVAADTSLSGLVGRERIDSQFWQANVRPSERYALSLPGTSRFRLSPLDRTFDNMAVAGDWTASGLNTGCVESAVMSGRLAAHALSGRPALEDIVGYDHP